MRLTDQHVSDTQLDRLISWFTAFPYGDNPNDNGLIEALLELKQRRAEDRQREDDDGK